MSWFAGGLLQQKDNSDYQEMLIPPCDPVVNSCRSGFADSELTIHFTAPVAVMSPFKVSIASPAALSNLQLMFRMKNMDMGIQQYRLERNKDGLWQADVVLPVCSLGRSDWTLTLLAEYNNTRWRGELDFTAAN
jgi:hypothetical protein